MKNLKIILPLIVLFIISFFLRSAFLPSNLFFGPEQGIDFMVVRNIVLSHKLTLIGAKTDISGIFHGPIYYYVSAIPFILSHGNPLFVSYFLIAVNCLTVFIMYLLAKELFDKLTGLIASVIFAVSFTAIIYPRWLSTHPLVIPLASLFFLFVARFLKGHKWSLFLAAIFFGLLTQSEFLNILFFSVIGLCIIIIYFKVFRKQNILYLLFCLISAGALSVGPFILFDIRHNYLISRNIISLLGGKTGYNVSYLQSLYSISQSLTSFIGGLILPQFALAALLVVILALGLLFRRAKRDKGASLLWLLFLWICIPPVLLFILHHQVLDQFYVSLIPAIILLFAYLINYLWVQKSAAALLVLVIIAGANLIYWGQNVPENSHIFFQSTQPDLRYSDELHAIDAIYHEAGNMPFSIQAYTIPYWEQQGWQYLFWEYGLPKYGYLPVSEKAPTLFVIVQDDPGNKSFQNNWLSHTVSTWGVEQEKLRFGVLTVYKLTTHNK